MNLSLKGRLMALSRVELVAGVAVALIVSGLGLRLLGSTVFVPGLALLRSVSDEALTLFLHAVGLLEILTGIVLLVLVAAHVRRRTVHPHTDSDGAQP